MIRSTLRSVTRAVRAFAACVFACLFAWIAAWASAAEPAGVGVGDDRRGYERDDYRSQSAQIASTGRPLDLVALIARPPLGLPAVPGAKPSKAMIDLGRRLFFDRRLSFNGTLSCGMCHVPEQGFTQNELATPVGFAGASVKRNAPALYNVAYRPRLFHDGREGALELQIWSPLLAANEMANPSMGMVVERIAALPEYSGAFDAAFGRGPDVVVVGQALAAYERGLLSADSAFDRWYFGHDVNAMTRSAIRGFEVFRNEGCASCHTIGDGNALFSDDEFHDTGVGYAASMRGAPSSVQLAPGVAVTVTTPIDVPAANDLGRYEATLQPADRWRYRTPTLRNVAVTAPYMHDGSMATLADVVDYYAAGGVPHEGQDARIRPLTLMPRDRTDLVAFLEALTGSNVDALAADARTVTIGDR
jgi:cytochrome c peroxidase